MDFDRWDTLSSFQHQVATWSKDNFGDQSFMLPLLGVGEEVGELNHAVLKNIQGIRTDENHTEQAEDAVGDIVVYLADFCERYGLSLENCVREAWNIVQHRDWKKK